MTKLDLYFEWTLRQKWDNGRRLKESQETMSVVVTKLQAEDSMAGLREGLL